MSQQTIDHYPNSFRPGLTARELIERLSALPPELPVVFYDDWTERVVERVEVGTIWDGVSENDSVPAIHLKGPYAHRY
jgi:hypothetical protein